jgi:polyhydroxyalkanoate synthase
MMERMDWSGGTAKDHVPAGAAAAEAPALAPNGLPGGMQSGVPGGVLDGALALAPERLLALQQDYLVRLQALWTDFFEHPERSAAPIGDARFSDPAWQENSLAAFMARGYLLNAEVLERMVESVQAEPKLKARLRFAVTQWLDAAAPSNFLAFNPKAQKRLVESRGQSLSAGLHNLFEDLAKGRISQADESAFDVGRNVATTVGAVVFENDVMQLIQYGALTPTVRARPLLIVPPCINKYYILDLQPQNSFIRYAVERGNTVFVLSWRNPGEELAHLGWDDYVERGPIAAIDTVRAITGAEQVNALGFCIGGTLLSTALAVMLGRGSNPVASLTLLASLLDFEDPGILGIFIDETHVCMREQTLGWGGLMSGRDLANTFSSLRANDLVWNYVVNNYLEGQSPPAFDLLYWNSDSTNLPGPMYAWYLRHAYLENALREPGRLRCCGQPLDLGRISVPTYAFGAREDHIVPWQAAYRSARVLTGVAPGSLRFVLGASGHIAGTINPVSKNRRSYWAWDEDGAWDGAPDHGGAFDGESAPEPGGTPGAGARAAPEPDAWLARAAEHAGSWWADWDRWLDAFGDGQRGAPADYGSARFPVIEAAPGRYVKQRVDVVSAAVPAAVPAIKLHLNPNTGEQTCRKS